MRNLKKIESERSLNYLLSPVINYNGSKPLPYQTDQCTFHSHINAKTFMMLDVITSTFRERWKSNGLYEHDPFTYFQMKGGFHLKMDADDFYKFRFLEKYKFSEIFYILNASQICLSNFKVKLRLHQEEENKFFYNNYIMNGTPQYLFTVNREDNNIILDFPTKLGWIYLNNILLLNLDYFPVILYNTSNFTQNFFRKSILPKWKCKELILSRKEIKNDLNISHNNNTKIDSEIRKSLGILEACKVIKKFSERSFRKRKEFFLTF